MENNNRDGEERDDNFDISFDDKVDVAFDELKDQGSGVQRVDPSSRKTMPNIDEIILKKEVELARAGRVDNVKDLDEDNGATGNDHSPENLSEMRLDDAIYAAMTIPPPRGDYDIVVEATRTEESLKAFITVGADLPHIMMEEPTLKEQMLLDDDFRAAGRVISLMEEAGFDTESLIDKVDQFVQSRDEHLSHGQICEIVMFFFKNLAASMLVVLGKSNRRADPIIMDFADQLIETEKRNEMVEDQSLIMTLRVVVKLGMLFEMRNEKANNELCAEFAGYLKNE